MISKPGSQPINILLVEDNEGDVVLIKEAFSEHIVDYNLQVAGDGERALQYLFRNGEFKDATPPDIIFLDLNIPRKAGLAVLKEIKASMALKSIPVIALTSSSNEDDIQAAYELHANCYIVKPVDYIEFVELIGSLVQFWFHVVRMPVTKYRT